MFKYFFSLSTVVFGCSYFIDHQFQLVKSIIQRIIYNDTSANITQRDRTKRAVMCVWQIINCQKKHDIVCNTIPTSLLGGCWGVAMKSVVA